MSRNLIARIAVSVAAIPIILWICYQGGLWLLGMITLFALVGMHEYLVAEGHTPVTAPYWGTFLAATVTFAILIFGYIALVDDGPMRAADALGFGGIWILSAIATLVFFVLSSILFALGHRPPGELFHTTTRLLWGLVYIAWLYPIVFLVGTFVPAVVGAGFAGGDLLLFLFAVLWVGDTSAMFFGMRFGRHKLAPAVSPNKTVEGFVGGIVGALAAGVAVYFVRFYELVPLYHVMIAAVGCSVFGQLGDLVESMWKRSLNIKDSSALIPGHGGVLDRFDSLLFAAPFLFAYFVLIVSS